MVTNDERMLRLLTELEPGLRRALTGNLRPDEVADALGEAIAWAWENQERLLGLDNPGGYLFRVAQSRSRQRKQGWLPWIDDNRAPTFEPHLGTALAALAPRQQSVVWLVDACGWTYAETAEALGITASAVGTHRARAIARLRTELGVDIDA